MLDRMRAAIIGALIAMSATAAPVWATALCGDLNNNGSFDVADAQILAASILLGANAADCGGMGTLQCGDVNGSGTLDAGDIVSVLNLVAGNPIIGNCTPSGTPVCNGTVSGTINTNVTWGTPGGSGTGCTIDVNGTTFVSPGVIVTVQRGMTVRGVKGAATPSVLVFLKGSQINAQGTPSEPILFTSNQPDGSRGAGDWGGVVLNGKARVNCPLGSIYCRWGAHGILGGSDFGGTNDADNSGVLQYARIEFTGEQISTDIDSSGLTLNAVGSGTTIDHVQVNQGRGDGFDWSGGAVRMKFLVASSIGDDDFDWQLGYRGSVQYALGIKNAGNSDTNGRHGIEGDNSEISPNAQPRSNPKLCNLTLVGTAPQGQSGSGRRGMSFPSDTAGQIRNTIVDGYTQSAIHLSQAAATRACVNPPPPPTLRTGPDSLRVQDTLLFGNGALATGSATDPPCTPAQWVGLLQASANLVVGDPNINELSVPYPVTTTVGGAAADGYVPTAAAATGASCAPLDPGFFDPVTYIGAFEPGTGAAGNWLITPGSWINFDTN